MDRNYKKGFTLIELLVVIAIIGILSAVVLASLNTARQRGADASIRSSINNARAQAALFYEDNGNSYNDGTTDVCNASNGVAPMVTAATEQAGAGNVQCGSDADGWAIGARLRGASSATSGNYIWYCVDSSGAATEVDSATNPVASATDTSCS